MKNDTKRHNSRKLAQTQIIDSGVIHMEPNMEQPEERRSNIFLYAAVLSVNLISIPMGSAFSWPSPVLPKLNGQIEPENNPFAKPITTLEESWIAAIVSLAAAIGPFAAGMCSDKIGRKRTLLLFAIPMLIGHIIFAFVYNVLFYIIGRLLVGIGCGCVFAVLPNYVSEISEDHNRGLTGCIMSVMLTFGTLLSYLIGPYVSIKIFSFTNMIPIVLFFITFGIFIPESPYYLVSMKNQNQAAASLMKLRRKSVGTSEKELLYITKNVEESMNNRAGLKDLVKSKRLIKGLVISCGLMVFQQLSGITAVVSYMQSIFAATGSTSTIPPDIAVIITGTVRLLTTFTTSQLADLLGKRILLMVSTMGCVISLTSLGLFFFMKDSNMDVAIISWLPVVSLTVYIVAYNIGLGPLAWAIMGELFPPNFKSMACSLTTFTCLMLAFLISMFFPHMALMLGMAQSFWLFAFFCAIAFIFTIFMVPETKGKSLQEIQELLSQPNK